MATSYTSLLGFALPVTGELDGTWGTVVNNSITQLVEDSVAGVATQSVAGGNWTLTTTGSGAANQARCAIIIPTGSPGVSRNIVAPSQSKAYIVINQSDAAVVFKGAATTGVTIATGTKILVAWNGSDFVQVGNTGTGDVVGPASATDNAVVRFDGTTGKLIQDSAVTIADTTGNITGGTYNGLTVTTTTGTFTLTNAKTLAVQNTLTLAGTDSTTMTFPSTSATIAGLGISQSFTGANTFYNSTGQAFGTGTSTQDGFIIGGRAGGTNTYRITFTPDTLLASRTVTFPDGGANYTVGYKNIPYITDKTGAYTLALADIGKVVGVGSGGSIEIPNSTFAAGDAVLVFNNTSAGITITCTITTAYIAGTDADKATVTLATRGVANILFVSSTVCVITGNVS